MFSMMPPTARFDGRAWRRVDKGPMALACGGTARALSDPRGGPEWTGLMTSSEPAPAPARGAPHVQRAASTSREAAGSALRSGPDGLSEADRAGRSWAVRSYIQPGTGAV